MTTRKRKTDGTVAGNWRTQFASRLAAYDRLVGSWLILLSWLVASGCTQSPTETVAKRSERLEVTNGLVAAYDFDEGSGTTLADVSGTGNTGTLSGPSWVTTGRRGGALSFDGTDDRVTVPDANSLDLTSGMTLMAWVKPATDDIEWQTVLMKERGASHSYILYATDGSGAPTAYLRRGTQDRIVMGEHAPLSDRWAHLAATYNGSSFRFYVNGKLQGTLSVSGTITTGNGVLTIGGNAVWGEWFNGLIDEIRIYNRGLSQSEVALEMGGLSPGPAPELVAAYNFDEGAGSAVSDAAGNSNTGSVLGATWTAAGKHGGALSFDGTDDRVLIADSASLDLTYGLTLSAWVNPTSITDWGTVILKELETTDLTYALYAADQNLLPIGYLNHDGSGVTTSGSSTLPLDTWSHLALTYDYVTLNLYVNGSLVATRDQAGAIETSDEPIGIGGNAVWGEWFQGRIDDVRIYNNGLTAAHVVTDMNTPVGTGNGCGTSCDDGNPCNGIETCVNNSCVSGTAVTCTATDQCHDAGTCNPATGVCSNPPKTNGTSCNDANACTQTDTCQSGTCTGSNPIVCTASDSCHDIGTCNTSTGVCSNPTKPNGAACNDATVCNGSETCQSGSCTAGTPPAFDDGNPCTADTCDPVAGVSHTPGTAGTSCSNGNACDGAETCNASATCVAGTPPETNDGNPCTTDACDPVAGITHAPVSAGTLCLDANACNGAETCNSTGTCVAGTPPTHDDGNPCTSDSCDQTGGVAHTPVAAGTSCNDANVCNGAETCDGAGACSAGAPASTDDANPCTTDSCDPTTGPSHVPLTGTACDDNDVCNGADTCDAGTCVHETSVDDGNPCTVDACDPQTGETTNDPVAEGTVCGDLCAGSGSCDGFGSCQVATPGAEIEDDQNPCTADTCNPADGTTLHVPEPTGASCETDSNECNGTDTCNAQAECVPGTPPSLDDSKPCTVDECVFVGSIGTHLVSHAPLPAGTTCGDDDSNPCNGVLTCDGSASCNVPRGTDDGNPCTTDSCNPASGIVNEVLPDGTVCHDGRACAGPGACNAGTCEPGELIGVDDNNPCTQDICEADGDVIHNPLPGETCDDGNVCNGTSICDDNGACVAGTPVLDDGNPCTIDSCDPIIGIFHEFAAVGTVCGEADLCASQRTCDGTGVCGPPVPVVVDDGNPCTWDSCDAVLGVLHAPAPTTVSCANENPCDGVEVCNGAGACAPGAPVTTSDGNPCTEDLCDPLTGVSHQPSDPGKDCGPGLVCDAAGSCRTLPPDPADVAPALAAGRATTVHESTRFLYTGSNPIQVGVNEETIVAQLAAVIRGSVITPDGEPLVGAIVSVKDHAELGTTFTRPDGEFDLVVNGGGGLTVQFAKPGYLPVQRKVTVRWQQFRVVEPVSLVPLDPNVSTIDFSAGHIVAQGPQVTDQDGTRRPTLIFQEGTVASMTLPSGEEQPLESMALRFTEYTVGENGPRSLPGELPTNVGYGYGVEVSMDEAIAAHATRVQFDRPVALYVDNFLGDSVGSAMPVADYDFETSSWIGDADAIIIRILDTSTGVATVDVEGMGTPATQAQLDALGFTNAELTTAALQFQPGQTLMRRLTTHFTPALYCKVRFEEVVLFPSQYENVGPELQTPNPDDDECEVAGCIVGVAGQTLRQTVPIAGTPFSLNYSSRLMPGHRPDSEITVRVTDSEILQSLAKVVLVAEFAGYRQEFSYEPAPNIVQVIHWDGVHRYGYKPQGRAHLQLTIKYHYRGKIGVPVYLLENTDIHSWAAAHNVSIQMADSIRREATVYPPLEGVWSQSIGSTSPTLSNWDARGTGLGGWTVDVNHVYDPTAYALITGDGRVRGSTGLVGAAFKSIGGADQTSTRCGGFSASCCSGVGCPDDGMLASQADLGRILDVLAMPDGSVLMANGYMGGGALWVVVRRIDRQGVIHTIRTVVGNPDPTLSTLTWREPLGAQPAGYEGARLALGSNGEVYLGVSSYPSALVWRLDFEMADEVRTSRVAGVYDLPRIDGNGVPALQMGLGMWGSFVGTTWVGAAGTIGGIAAARDGKVYIAASNLAGGAAADKIYEIGTDGIGGAIAGTGVPGFSGDGGPAVAAQLNRPSGLAISDDGTLYVADSLNWRVRAIRPGGFITTVAGIGSENCPTCGDGVPAENAFLGLVRDVALPSAGSFYALDQRRVTYTAADGIIQTVAGHVFPETGLRVEGPARDLLINSGLAVPQALDVEPDGRLLIADQGQVFRVGPQFPGVQTSDIMLPSPNGSHFYRFDPNGRHLETVDSETGAAVLSFEYTATGGLRSITDAGGNVTEIEYDGTGAPTRIVSPFGQTTALALDSNGFLSDIIDPLGGAVHSEYSADGLMESFTDALDGVEHYSFDSVGRLLSASGPDLASKTFAVEEAEGVRVVTEDTAGGRTVVYRYERLPTGDVQRDVSVAGLTTTTVTTGNGRSTYLPNGMIIDEVLTADARFGMLAPFVSERTEVTPSGLQRRTLRGRTFDTLTSPSVETVTANGRSTNVTYEPATRTRTTITPAGRMTKETVDPLSRITRAQVAGLVPIDFAYDTSGRLDHVTRGARTTQNAYIPTGAARGYLTSITDATGTPTTFTRDPLGRTLTETRASATTSFGWDPLSNLASVTPPGKPIHEMNYTPANLLESYEPPPTGLPASATGYTYDLDRMLRTETRPGGVSIVRTPDSAGRLDTVAIPGGLIDYDYFPSNATSGAGKVSSIAGPYGVDLAFTYDGALTTSTSWSGDVTGSVTWQYNNDFQKILETVSGVTGSASTRFGYDNDLLLTCASPTTCSPPGADALTLTRHPQHGMVTNIALGQTNEAWTYNGFGELARQTASFNGSPLVDVTYDTPGFERDALGRIVRKTETILGVTKVYEYRYDALRRLDQVKIDGVVDEEFTYDGNGNRLTAFKQGIGTVSATYDDQDRLLAYGTLTFTYTANGELETKTNTANGDEWVFQYDAFGNLVSVGLPNGDLVEYLVDGMGRRVGKKKNGVLLKQWLYRDALKPVAELDGAGALVTEFVYGSKRNVPDYVVRGGATYRVVSDHLGSPRYAVNVANLSDVPFSASYSSFGEVTGTGTDWMPVGFAGGIHDDEVGLLRFGARDYDAGTGRWSRKEPMRFVDGPNLYAYTNNDPVNYIDANGQWLVPVIVVAGIASIVSAYLMETGNDARNKANFETEQRYPGEPQIARPQGGPADAFRHCMLSCLWSNDVGGPTARLILDLREEYSEHLRGFPKHQCEMDKDNNALGAALADLGANGYDDCAGQCQGAVDVFATTLLK